MTAWLWLLALRQLVEDVGGLVHPAALLACRRPHLAERLPEAERAVGDGEFGRDRQATSLLQIEQQLPPRLRALARAVGEAEQLLLALRRRADDHQDALRVVLKAGLQVDAVGPDVDVALGRQIALPPVLVLVDQTSFSRAMVEADRPPAHPCRAGPPSASSKSPVEMPFR